MLFRYLLLSFISLIVYADEHVDMNHLKDFTSDSFDTLVKDADDWFLMFHAPWCGHCKKFKPTFAKVATKFDRRINFGLVDCTKEKALCERFDVRGFPSLKFHRGGEYHVYESSRTEEHVSFFCEKMLLPDLIPATKKEVDEMLLTLPENVVFALIGDVDDAIREEFRKIAHMLRPAPMSPNFITVSKNVIPNVEVDSGLVVLKHGDVNHGELTTSGLQQFVDKYQKAEIINFNMWWRRGLKVADTVVMIVLKDASKKSQYLNDIMKLVKEHRSPGSTNGTSSYVFGFVVDDGNDISSLLKNSFDTDFSEAPLLLMYDTYNMRYLTKKINTPSGLSALFHDMIDSSEWVEMLNVLKRYINKLSKFFERLPMAQKIIFCITIVGGLFVIVYICSDESEETLVKKNE